MQEPNVTADSLLIDLTSLYQPPIEYMENGVEFVNKVLWGSHKYKNNIQDLIDYLLLNGQMPDRNMPYLDTNSDEYKQADQLRLDVINFFASRWLAESIKGTFKMSDWRKRALECLNGKIDINQRDPGLIYTIYWLYHCDQNRYNLLDMNFNKSGSIQSGILTLKPVISNIVRSKKKWWIEYWFVDQNNVLYLVQSERIGPGVIMLNSLWKHLVKSGTSVTAKVLCYKQPDSILTEINVLNFQEFIVIPGFGDANPA